MTSAAKILVFDRSRFGAELLSRALQDWYAVVPPVFVASEVGPALGRHNPTMAVLRIAEGDAGMVRDFLMDVQASKGVPCIVMGPARQPQLADPRIDLGVAGYLSAESELIELRLAIETVREGGRYVSPEFRAVEGVARLRPDTPFTRKQGRVLRLRQQGKSNSEIGLIVGTDIKSVEKLFCGMRRKLGMVGRADLDWHRVEG